METIGTKLQALRVLRLGGFQAFEGLVGPLGIEGSGPLARFSLGF